MEQERGGEKLSAHIDKLFESNTRISDQANNLTIALRGSSKAQGAWGELILERTLEAAGLRPGHEYDAQQGYAGGNRVAIAARCSHPPSGNRTRT